MATKTVIGRKQQTTSREEAGKPNAPRAKKGCVFCDTGTEPTYVDAVMLRKFMSDRAKIINRSRTGVCSKHQRLVAKEIKHARHLSLLPFTARI